MQSKSLFPVIILGYASILMKQVINRQHVTYRVYLTKLLIHVYIFVRFFREIIKQSVNASSNDVVIFTGSGATPAIHKIAWGLDLNKPKVASETVRYRIYYSGPIKKGERGL